MLVVSLMVLVSLHLGCYGQSAIIFSRDLGLKINHVKSAKLTSVSLAYNLGEPRLKQFGKS